MKRLRRAATVALALASALAAAELAGADPPDVAASQIGRTAKGESGADQLPDHPSRNAAGVLQLSAPPERPAAPAQITAPAAGRNTQVQAIAGRDRCDPAAPEARAAECARIPENRAQDFQPADADADATANTVDSSAPSADLVNGILSSGTGSVVQLPPK